MEVKLLSRIFCLCILFNFWVNGMQILFFRDYNHRNLYNRTDIKSGCNIIPGNPKIQSCITETCVILYPKTNSNCGIPEDYDNMILWPGMSNNLDYDQVQSFRQCVERNSSEKSGGLDIAIVGRPKWQRTSWINSYRNICTCINIPNSLQSWAIQSYQNNYVAYYDSDCAQAELSSKLVFGSQEWITYSNFEANGNVVKSIGPATNSTYFHESCTLQLILNLEKSNVKLNKSQKNITATLQKQQDQIHKLEQQYNDIALKLENYQHNLTNKLRYYQDNITGRLENIMNELDDDDKFRS